MSNTTTDAKITAFIEQYMTASEFLAYSFIILVLFFACMITYIIYKVIVTEKAAKKQRRDLKVNDVVHVHSIRWDCTVSEINENNVQVTINVPKHFIYAK